jgi:hypothetical protein
MPFSLSQGANQWTRRSALAAISSVAAFAQRPARKPYTWVGMPTELPALVDRYRMDLRATELFYPITYSALRFEVMEEFHQTWLKGIESIDFAKLDVEGRIDWLLLRNTLQRALADLQLDRRRWKEMEVLVSFAPALWKLEEKRQRVDPIEGKDTAGILVNVVKQIKELDTWLKKPDISKPQQTVALRAHRLTLELDTSLKRWFAFYQGYDPTLEWWLKDPVDKLSKSLADYAAVLSERGAGLKKDDKDTIVGDPVGREAILSDLKFEMIAYQPEELIAIADREFAWCEAEMKKASRELGHGEDWKAALERVKNLHRDPGGQPKMIVDMAVEAIEYVTSRDLVTVPQLARDSWRMLMMSPERQRVNPFFLGGESIIVSFPTNTMTHEEKLMSMRGNNEHFSRATVHHELIPGHNLQRFYTTRYRTYRNVFNTPFWLEGWALWWEMLLWDLGFARNAEDKVGMLFWRMHRCARIVFSLRFHLGMMKAQECVDFLVDRVGHERDNAAAEVRRSFEGTYPPLYQAAYMLGGLQIRGLHRELVLSGKMKVRDFHDRILLGNTLPIEMVRASLTGTRLEKDFVAKWRF